MEGPSLRIQRLERERQLNNSVCRGILELLKDVDGWEERSSQSELLDLAGRGNTWAWLVTQGPFQREVGFAVITTSLLPDDPEHFVLEDFAVREGPEHERITQLLWHQIEDLVVNASLPLDLRVPPGQPGEVEFLASVGIVPNDQGVWSLA